MRHANPYWTQRRLATGYMVKKYSLDRKYHTDDTIALYYCLVDDLKKVSDKSTKRERPCSLRRC